MKWLKRKIRNWLDDDSNQISSVTKASRLEVSPGSDFDEPLRLSITKAHGGIIVNSRRYSSKHDRHDGDVYIITDEQNLSEEIGKIVSMECLKL